MKDPNDPQSLFGTLILPSKNLRLFEFCFIYALPYIDSQIYQ